MSPGERKDVIDVSSWIGTDVERAQIVHLWPAVNIASNVSFLTDQNSLEVAVSNTAIDIIKVKAVGAYQFTGCYENFSLVMNLINYGVYRKWNTMLKSYYIIQMT